MDLDVLLMSGGNLRVRRHANGDVPDSKQRSNEKSPSESTFTMNATSFGWQAEQLSVLIYDENRGSSRSQNFNSKQPLKGEWERILYSGGDYMCCADVMRHSENCYHWSVWSSGL